MSVWRIGFAAFRAGTVCLLAALCWAAPAWAGSQYAIVSSEPPSEDFPPGKVLSVGDRLTVPEGAVVTLLGEDGSVAAIPGPADVAITEDAVETSGPADKAVQEEKRSTLSKIAGLLAGEHKRNESLGVSRGVAGRPKPEGLDDPWALSVHRSGAGCSRDGEVVLGRKDARNAISLSVRVDGKPDGLDTVWKSGEAKFSLPPELSGGAGKLAVQADKDFASIEVKALPPGVNQKNPLDVLGWLIASGCESQAVTFTRQLAREAQ